MNVCALLNISCCLKLLKSKRQKENILKIRKWLKRKMIGKESNHIRVTSEIQNLTRNLYIKREIKKMCTVFSQGIALFTTKNNGVI